MQIVKFEKIIRRICWALLFLTIVFLCFFRFYKVDGLSMLSVNKQDGLQNEKYVLTLRAWVANILLDFKLCQLKHGDIVIYKVPLCENSLLVKRIIACPFDMIIVKQNQLQVNNYIVKKGMKAFQNNIGLFNLNKLSSSNLVTSKFYNKSNGSIDQIINNIAHVKNIAQYLTENTIYDYGYCINVNESPIREVTNCNINVEKIEIKIPDNSYFVTGERPSSYDSRLHGFVPKERILTFVIL